MRLLVFCGTRDALARFDHEKDWQIIASIYPWKFRNEILKRFRDQPGSKLAVDRSMLHGWRATGDTVVLFDASWPYAPDSPESVQAAARAGGMPWSREALEDIGSLPKSPASG